ncbi:MAG: hypothetical protein WCF68_15315 [Terriglobales bacterium]
MTSSRLFPLASFVAMTAFLVCGQNALAQQNQKDRLHIQAYAVPATNQGISSDVVEKKILYQLSSGFGALPPLDANSDYEWPCFPNPANPNYADCSSIATGGVVIGTPAFTQSLTSCDDSTSTISDCGQIFWFYEDDTGDTTDDLIVTIAVKQGKNYIMDVVYDFGPNPYPAGSVVIISDNTAFGTLGETGPGNGFCYYSTQTCVNPKAGLANATVTTTVGTSTIKSTFNIFLK